ncbi:MAG: UDP-N-acetylmuramate dehydrogenase, partial [Chloroflexota bacterium]
MSDVTRTLEEVLGSRLERGHAMREFTTTGIGGRARAVARASSQADLVELVRLARETGTPYLLLGGGSNLLVSDGGVDSLVIKIETAGIARAGEVLTVQAGTRLQDLVDFTVSAGLGGLHRMTGIPGSVGGAVYGNAGAYGQSISDHLEEVIAFDGRSVVAVDKTDCEFMYRYSAFKATKWTILSARFRLPGADPAALARESGDVLATRLTKYPVGLRCPGSFFMNVPVTCIEPEVVARLAPDKILYGKVPAGYLLDEVDAKGLRLGDIQISDKNANLFINLGEGRAE